MKNYGEKLENNPNALKFKDHQFNDSINDTAINHNYYFKIGKNQKEFGVPDDYVRGYQLKIAEAKITKNMMNYGVGSAVKYYLDNVSTKDVSYEDVYFNEQSELELYLAVAQMLAVADESVVNKYRKDFENTRVISNF